MERTAAGVGVSSGVHLHATRDAQKKHRRTGAADATGSRKVLDRGWHTCERQVSGLYTARYTLTLHARKRNGLAQNRGEAA